MKHALSAGVAALLLAGSAHAFVYTVGQSSARDCYEAAISERDDFSAVQRCTFALGQDALTSRDRSATLINRGIIYLNRGQHARALADFDAAIANTPDLAEGYIHRGVALLAYQDYRAAIEALNQGLALEPTEPAKAYFHRAIAHEELGDIPAAYHDYRRAVELAPEWRAAQQELARFRVTGR